MSTVFDRAASVQSLPTQARPQTASGRGARQAVVTAVAVALLGNFVGGGLLIGGYYAYANDDSRWLRRQPHHDEAQAAT